MFKRFAITMIALVTAVSAFAQNASDLERRLRELEQRVQQLQDASASKDLGEIERQIEILGRELEAIKNRQSEPEARAGAQQFGLGAAASKVYRSEGGFSIGGYGEMLYQNYDSADRRDTADLLRAIVYTGYKFNERTIFNSELEVEHANTEHGGVVEMEFAYLDFLLRPQVNVRTGFVLMPVGLLNEQHEPTAFFGARRPAVEGLIIPTTWSELGVGAFGDIGPISYRAFLTTGLNSEGFAGEEGIREGRQGASQALAEDWAVVGRADWHVLPGTLVGGSLYSGNSGQGRGFSGRVKLGEVHGDARFRGISLRALYAKGSIGDAARISEANALDGGNSIGKSFGGWYVEGGYDLAALLRRGEMSLSPYVRYERLDTQRSVPAGFRRNPVNDQKILTVGVAFKPIQQTVIKLDWQNIENRERTGTDQFNVAVGYIF